MRATWIVRLSALLTVAVAIPACSHDCLPKELLKRTDLIDLSATQPVHAPVDPGPSRELMAESQRLGAARAPDGRPYQMLVLTGGGLFASYGIGILKGWSESGTRPEFDMVTGVSSGALLATFAFLGSDYDKLLKDRLVGLEPKEALRMLPLCAIPLAGAVFSTQPLTKGVYEAITPEVLCAVARAHAAGRRLYIATTALDSRRMVLWDMGAIAARGDAEALELYRFVILASSAIPGALPPVIIPVEVNGTRYQELHVDGAVSETVVFRTNLVGDLNRVRGVPGPLAPRGSTLYVIDNDRFYPEPQCVKGLFSSLGATFGALYSNKTRDELDRVYLNCLQTGLAFRLTAIRPDLGIATNSTKLTVVDQEKLHAVGRQIGRAGPTGPGWLTEPPGLEPVDQLVPRTGTHFATPDNHP